MDISNSAVKTPDAESETPSRIQAVKPPPPLPSSNGVLKRHPPLLPHHHAVVVTYKECLKNHAASLGGHALDGCGEFMPLQGSDPAEPASLKCAACGCHRNFHRREPDETLPPLLLPALEYRPHHRHHPPPPPPRPNSGSPDNSPSPPPISSSYYPSAPHMLLALSHGLSGPPLDGSALIAAASPPLLSSNSRKRFRTKFTQNQKEKMLEFAERVEWKMQRKDEDLISEFCSEIGVEKGVLKVWMHNNKSNFCKKENQSNSAPPPPTANGGGISYAAASAAAEDSESEELRHHLHHDSSILGTTGSSSS